MAPGSLALSRQAPQPWKNQRKCRPAHRCHSASVEIVEKGANGRRRLLSALASERLKTAAGRLGEGPSDLQRHIASGAPRVTRTKSQGPAAPSFCARNCATTHLSFAKPMPGLSWTGSASAARKFVSVAQSPSWLGVERRTKCLLRRAVLSFVKEWRARQDSNLWPLPSEQFNLPYD